MASTPPCASHIAAHGTTMMLDESWNRRRPAGARLTASSAPCQYQCTPAHHRLLLDITLSPEIGRESPDDSRGFPPPSSSRLDENASTRKPARDNPRPAGPSAYPPGSSLAHLPDYILPCHTRRGSKITRRARELVTVQTGAWG
ncbi:hypothetical protein IMZ48_26795 [Candidatus Bathyarchaeota archaeon]|nr:hypothetical protein [Candidatus Bathyarchaeota archaeon]